MSWKKYGGTNKLESLNNLTVNSIVTDSLSLRKFYLGDWDICGGLRVKDNAIIFKDTDLCGNLIVGKDTSLMGEFSVAKDTNLFGNLVVLNDAYFSQSLYFDPSGNTLLHAMNGGFGFNKYNPLATIDISSDRIQTVYMKTSTIENRNIYAQNRNSQGVVVGADSGNTYINMFVDQSMNSSGTGRFDGQLRYASGGHFYIDVSNVMNVRPRTVFGADLTKPMNTDADRVVIYDTPVVSHPYLKDIYINGTFKTGTPLALIAQETFPSDSNVFMRMTTETGNGFTVGGGTFEGGMMGVLALTDGADKYPSMNIFSGDLDKYLKTSIGVNKHRVSKTDLGSNRYILDVNGPTKMIHQELLMNYDVSMQIFAMEFCKENTQIGYAIGSPYNADLTLENPTFERYFLKTEDGGYTWSRDRILIASTGLPDPNLESASSAFFSIYVFSVNFVIIGGVGGFLYYTNNGGIRWTQVQYNGTPTFSINAAFANINGSRTILGLNTGEFIDTSAFTNPNIVSTIRINSLLPLNNKYSSGLSNVLSVDGSNNYVYMVGVGGIQGYMSGTGGVINPSARFFTGSIFLDVSVFYGSDGKYHSVAVGANGLLKYVHASLITDAWSTPETDIFDPFSTPGNVIAGSLNSVHVFSERHAIAVGNNGLVIYSDDGFVNWKPISHTDLDAMGNGSVISSLRLSNIFAVDGRSEFVIVGDVKNFNGGSQQGQVKVFTFYAPYFFNRARNFVLEASGSILLSGDLRINDNGNVFTNSNSISLFPDVATEINIGNTVLGGYTNVKHNLDVIGNAHVYQKLIVDSYSFLNDDVSLNGKLYVTKDASLNSNLFVGRDASFGSKLYLVDDASFNSRFFVGGDVSLNSNLYLVDDASFNSRFFVGGDVSLNANLYLVDDASFNSRFFVGGDVSLNANLYLVDDASFNSRFFVGGDVSLNSNLYLVDDASFNSRFFVGGDVSLNANLYLVDDASFNSRFFVGGDVSLNSNLYLVDDASFNSRLFVGGDVSLNSNLYLVDDASFNSRLFVGKDVSLGSKLYVVDDASFNSRLFVGKDVSLNANLYLVDDASFNSRLFVGKDVSLGSKLYLVNDASFNSRLFVGRDASFGSKLYVANDVSFNRRLFVGGDVSLNSNLYVVNDASFNSRLFVGGDVSLGSNLYVVDDVSLNSRLYVGGDVSLGSKLYVVDDVSFNSRLYVGGDVSLNSNLYVVKDVSMNSRLFVGGDVSLNSNLYVVKDVSMNSRLFVGGDASFGSNLCVANDVSFNRRLFVGGDVSLNSNLYVVNDASFNSRLFVGGDVSLGSNLYVVDDASFNSRLYVGGDVSLGSNLYVVRDASLNRRLFVGGDVSLNSNLYVVRDASLNSRLFVGSDVSLGSKLHTVGDVSFNSCLFVGGDVSMGSKLYVVGDASFNSRLYLGGDMSLMSKLSVVGDVSFNSHLFVGDDVSVGAKLRVADKSTFESDVSINANLFVIDVSARHLDLRGTRNSDGVGSGALIVQGGASIGNDLNVGGNLYINNYLDVVDGTDHIHFGYTNTRKMYIGSSDFTDEIRIGTSISGVRGSDVDIYIGSNTHSRIHILGNLLLPGHVTFENQTNLEIINKTILLNDQALPGSSYGSGLYIREDGSDTAGQILVNPSMTGFFLKATRSPNIVNFETNGMTLPDGLGRGILTIVPTTTLDGSNYTIARGNVYISDIDLLDASLNNRVMRNPVTTLTQVNTQVIDSKLSTTGLYVNKLEATAIANAQVDISGNAIVSRMGLGSSVVRPEYVLDINGNTFSNGAILQW
jgi:predicted acyltransferase (DUF342 family)/photosystem II stability/assembly factor-like uncharacterized protein